MFKKALVLVMAIAMVFSLASCGNGGEGKVTPTAPNNKVTVDPNVTPNSASKKDPNQTPSSSSKKATDTAEWPKDEELLKTVIKPEFGTLDSVNEMEDGSIIIKLRGATNENLSDYYDAYKAAGFEGDYMKEAYSFNVSDANVNVKVALANDSGAMTITVTPK